MSALTNGPDTVVCVPKVITGVDRTGSNVLGNGLPVTYKGVSVQPIGLSAFTQAETPGLVNADYLIIKAFEPAWVGGPKSTIRWNGMEFDQVGVVRRFGRGRHSKSEEIKLKARSTEVK